MTTAVAAARPLVPTRPTAQHAVIDPATLDARSRARLLDALYACHCRIFDGVDRDAFAAYVVDSPATSTRIFIVRDAEGRIRGYCAFHIFDIEHEGRAVTIVRMEAGFEPAFRSGTIYGRFAVRQFIRARLHAGRRPLYFVCCPVHPSSFVTLARSAPRVWTQTDAGLSANTRRFLGGIARTLGMLPVGQGVYHVGWITRPGPAPRRISPEAARFLAANPGYVEGHGLLTVVPVGLADLVGGIARFARQQLGRLFGRR